MSRMTGARFIAESLQGYGVTHVFFVEAILRGALLEMEALGIRRVLTHSEKAAAYMADGYARAARRPGVCMAQSVGAANLASGLQEPFLGAAPVVALTGRKSLPAQYRNAYQEVLHGPLFQPVTKYNVAVDAPVQLPHLLRQAFREATTGRPGPAHLDLLGHQGHIIEDAEVDAAVIAEAAHARVPAYRPSAEPALVAEAAQVMARARRPVIVAGGGAAVSGAGWEIQELAERLAIPVATSLNGKETLLETHRLNVGVVGRYSRWCANRIVAEADLVLYAGSNTGDHVTNGWTIPRPGTPVIQIDIDAAELGRSYPNVVGLAGDAKTVLRQLLQCLPAGSVDRDWGAHAQQTVQAWRDEVAPLMASDAVPIRPQRLCRDLTAALPADAILVADTGYSAIWSATMVHLTQPGQRYLRCAGSLGWGFPASLGAKCGAPDRPVVCFTGDGGMWYHLSELETAVRCGIPTVTVVNNNLALGQCAGPIRRLYGQRPGNPAEMYGFGSASFAGIAEEMGCLGVRVEKPADIGPAIREALAQDRPAVVEVMTDVNCPAPEPWAP
jgi:acetolactate synthase-1/2/3 large subunit